MLCKALIIFNRPVINTGLFLVYLYYIYLASLFHKLHLTKHALNSSISSPKILFSFLYTHLLINTENNIPIFPLFYTHPNDNLKQMATFYPRISRNHPFLTTFVYFSSLVHHSNTFVFCKSF